MTVDAIKIYGFTGLMYIRGLYSWNNHSLRILFSEEKGMPVFEATMSRLRFSFIVQHLCFDVEETRATRWQSDRFAALRDLFEACNNNFAAALVPEDYLIIDETLYPMRNQIAFKQYNPDKPAMYGLLFKSVNCGRYPSTYQSHVYSGKPVVDPSCHYVQGSDSYIRYLVTKLSDRPPLQRRNI